MSTMSLFSCIKTPPVELISHELHVLIFELLLIQLKS